MSLCLLPIRRVFSNQVQETRRTITLNGLSVEVCLREISVIDQICCRCHFVSRSKFTFFYLSVCLSYRVNFLFTFATSCLSSFPSVFVVVLYTAKKRKSPYSSIDQMCWWNGSIFLRKSDKIMREDSSGWVKRINLELCFHLSTNESSSEECCRRCFSCVLFTN